MTPVSDCTRHCASCDKEITDFSSMTDAQIGRTLQANGRKICGRFHLRQLNRPLLLNGPRRRRGLGPLAAAASLLLAGPVFGQSADPIATEQTEKQDRVAVKSGGPVVFRGVINDSEGYPLIGVSILIKGTSAGTVTDLDGVFELTADSRSELTVVVSYTGFESLETVLFASEVSESTDQQHLPEIVLEESTHFLTGIVVTCVVRPRQTQLDHLMNHKIDRIVIDRPLGHKNGDWKDYWRDLFAKRKAHRAERRAQRLEAKIAKAEVQQIPPAETLDVPSFSAAPASVPLGLRATPNPFDAELTVSFVLEIAETVELTLLDANGRSLRSWQREGSVGKQDVRLDQLPGKLPSGTYFLRLATQTGGLETITVVR